MKTEPEEPETRGAGILNVFIDVRACSIYHAEQRGPLKEMRRGKLGKREFCCLK